MRRPEEAARSRDLDETAPLGGCFAAAVLSTAAADQLLGQLLGQLGGQLGGQLRDQLGDQLLGQLGDQLGDQLLGELGGQLRGQLVDQLGGQLRGQLRDQLGDQLGDQLLGQLGGQLVDQLLGQLVDQLGGWWSWACAGQHFVPWVAWLRFGQHIGASLSPSFALDGLDGLSDAGWWWPYEGVVVLTERPITLSRDPDGRLHSTTRQAIGYSDGWGIWVSTACASSSG